MTVIAYDGELLVADGRSTRGTELVSDSMVKFHKFDHPNLGVCVGAFCGSVLVIEPWIEFIEQNGFEKYELPMEDAPMGSPYSCAGVVVTEDGEVIEISTDGLWSTIKTPEAWGSGSTIAQHYLKTGSDAVTAVIEACKTDIGCGGKITSYNPVTKEFKTERD